MQDHRGSRVLAAARRAAVERRRSTTALVGAMAALAIVPAADAAVQQGRTLEVAHGRDLVIADGYPENRELVLEVVRRGVVIATTHDQHYKTDRSGFLEVNHVGATDCFDGGTAPDIRPGDTIRATVGDPAESTDIDEMVVKNVTYDGAPVERMVDRIVPAVTDPATGDVITPESIVEEGTGVFEVRGTALQEDGVTPLEGEVEVRLNHPSRANWDATERRDWRVTAQAGADGRYVAAFDTNSSEADKAAIGDAEMAALWLGGPANELSGYDGPGSPCNPAPNAGITSVSPELVNANTASITVNGYAPADAVITVQGEAVPVSEAGGWSYSVSAADLADDPFTITAIIDGVPVSRTVMVDRTAPDAPTASLAGGEHVLPQTIHLGGENELRYTTDGSEPTKASVKYTGGISVTSALTIKAIAIDPAGNPSPVATFAYTQKPAPPVVAPPAQPPVIVVRPVPVEIVREIVREVIAPAPPPVVVPPVGTPAVPAGIDKVAAPKRVTLTKARKGVAITVTTKAASLRAKATRGAKVTLTRKPGTGYALVFTAKRAGTYTLTLAVPKAAAKVVTIKVR